jgi:3-oxoacyl-(acyl-carrier-protein) synthase
MTVGALAMAERAATAGLAVRAAAAWPELPSDGAPQALPGFVESSFSPLVAAVAERCLRRAYGEQPPAAARAERTAIVLLSRLGDVTTATRLAEAVDGGTRVAPLLFFQAVPNAVAGYVAARWGLAGPVVCLGHADDGLEAVRLLLDDGDADEALVVMVSQSTMDSEGDSAVAVLVGDEGVQS